MPAPSRVAAALVLAACAVHPAGPPPRGPAAPAGLAAPQGPPTRILSAHAQPPPGPDERDYFGVPVGALVYVVFSRPLDPASLVPGRFVVLARDGTRRVPIAASLAPASERDELRALELVVPAPQRELVSITVIGQLFDADGRDIDGLSADIAPADAPPFPVAADRMPEGTGCPGPAARVWWSVPVAPGGPGVRLQLGDGRALPPAALADIACAPGVRLADDGPAGCDVADDSVIDYCAPAGGSIERVELDPGAARGRGGQPAAGGTLVLQDMPPRT